MRCDDNVVELMKSKLQQVPVARICLSIAACLGAAFKVNIVASVFKAFYIEEDVSNYFFFQSLRLGEGQDTPGSIDRLQECEREGFIECGS